MIQMAQHGGMRINNPSLQMIENTVQLKVKRLELSPVQPTQLHSDSNYRQTTDIGVSDVALDLAVSKSELSAGRTLFIIIIEPGIIYPPIHH